MKPSNHLRWSKEESNQLLELVGDMPLQLVHGHYNAWAKRTGFQTRSFNSIRHRCFRAGVSVRSTGEWLNRCDVARILGIKEGRFVRLERKRVLVPLRRVGCIVISRSQLAELARSHPSALWGSSRDGLWNLLADVELVEAVLNAPPMHWLPITGPILEPSTGRAWPDPQTACRDLRIKSDGLSRRLHGKVTGPDGKPLLVTVKPRPQPKPIKPLQPTHA